MGGGQGSAWRKCGIEKGDFVGAQGKGLGVLGVGDCWITSLACFPSGGRLAFGSGRGSLRIDDITTGSPLHESPGHGTFGLGKRWSGCLYPTLSPTGSALSFRDPASGIWLWQIGSPSLPRLLDAAREAMESHAVWSGDGSVVAARRVVRDGMQNAQLWSVDSEKCIADFSVGSGSPADTALSLDGKILAVPESGGIELRDALSGKVLRRVSICASKLAWSPDGKILAAVADSGVALCDPATGMIARTLSGPTEPLVAITWSPDGRSLAGASPKKRPLADEVVIWDVHSGDIRRSFDAQMSGLNLLQWLSDTRTIVLANREQLAMFDADSGKLIRMVDTIADDVSSDGHLAVEGGPAWVRLHSLPDARSLGTLLCLRDGRFAVISPDGHFRGLPDVEKELVYVVQTDAGQETLTPEEFSKRYGWKNDPEKVTLKTDREM